jgi:hypothetical protein
MITKLPRSYRIGFLNPWSEKSENQAYLSLRIAAQRIGHELVQVTNSDEIIVANLDFVLAVHPNQPKTTEVPTFGVIHSPRALLLKHDYYGQNLLTYDGYLTIMDTVDQFLRAICAGAGRPPHIGYYLNSPQRQFLRCDIEEIVALDALRLCYFTTNWDLRSRPLFRSLARRSYMRIYGPAQGWDYLDGTAYRGSVPFDGHSVQEVYARFGAGLVTLSKHHALDDVISNRIFEISSVGAAAICPDIPWIRKHFGDTVLYYDAFGPVVTAVQQIDDAVAKIARNPHRAAEQADKARLTFEEKFAAEVMLDNAVTYFEEWRERAGKPVDPANGPLIDIIVRVGGRTESVVSRTIRSIEAQSEGRFRVILVRYKPIDLGEITRTSWRRIEGFEVVDELGGGRAATLTRGLRAVRSALFAVLDDGDFWLPGHITALLAQIEQTPPGRAYAYSGYLTVDEPAPGEPATARERRHIASMEPINGDIWKIMGTFASHCWLASSGLLRFIDLDDWPLSTAEDSVLQASLMARADPLFSYRATACSVRGSEGTLHFGNATRAEDVFECFARFHTVIDRIERKAAAPSMSNWSRLNWALQRVLEAKSRRFASGMTRLVLEEGVISTSVHDRDDIERQRLPLTSDRVSLAGMSQFVEHAGEPALTILPPSVPWAYGARIRLDIEDLFSGAQSLVVEFAPLMHTIGVGLLDETGADFTTRLELQASAISIELWFPLQVGRRAFDLIVQNWAEPCPSAALLRGIWAVRELTPRSPG